MKAASAKAGRGQVVAAILAVLGAAIASSGFARDAAGAAVEVRTIVVAPSSPDVVYAVIGQGLFRSGDAGRSWNRVSADLPAYAGPAAVDAQDPDTVYLEAAGLLRKSIDGGARFDTIEFPLDVVALFGFVVDPIAGGTVYTAVNGGVLRSTDGGASWVSKSSGLFGGPNTPGIAIAPGDPSVLYAETGPHEFGGVFVTRSAGDEWTSTNAPAFAGVPAVDPHDAGIGFVFTPLGPPHVYRTKDFGTAWTPSNDSFLPGSMTFDPTRSGVIFAPHGPILYRSTDEGDHWSIIASGPPDESIQTLAFTGTTLLIGTSKSGVYRSEDGGIHWKPSNGGLRELFVGVTPVAPAEPVVVFRGGSR